MPPFPDTVVWTSALNHNCMVAEGYNGFHARFSKFTGKIFDLRLQRSTFNRDSTFRYFSFHNAIVIFNAQLCAVPTFNRDSVFQRSTAIPTFNRDSVFQRSSAIPTFNHDSVFQLSSVNATFNCDWRTLNHDSTFQRSSVIATFNRDSTFQRSTAIPSAVCISTSSCS